MEEPLERSSKERTTQRAWLWPLIGLIAVATLLAVGLVPDDQTEREPLPEFATPEPSVESLNPPQPEPAPPIPSTPEPNGEGDTARRLIAELRDQSDPDLAAVYEQAERLRADAKLADAWLIHFFAARKGYAPSALVLGTLADPLYHEAGSEALEEADAAQAYKWYKVAASEGDPEASRRLETLRERTKHAAAGGDTDAQRLLLQWR